MLMGALIGILAGYMIAICHGLLMIGKDKRKELKDRFREAVGFE